MNPGPTPVAIAVQGLHLLLEVAALVAFGAWGASLAGSALGRTALAVAVPLVVAVIWGLFAAPRAAYPVAAEVRNLIALAVFAAATAALFALQRPVLATAFGLLAAVDVVLRVLRIGA